MTTTHVLPDVEVDESDLWSVRLGAITGRCVGNMGRCRNEPQYSALLDYCGPEFEEGIPDAHPVRSHEAVVDCAYSDDDVLLCADCATRVRSFASLVSIRSITRTPR